MKVIISDCDHQDIEIERKIFSENNIFLELQQNLTEEDVIHNCQEASVIINQYAPFTEKVLSQLPHLKLVVRYGVGVNNIDLAAATKYGVQICNVPDYGTHEVADHALALMLTLTRKITKMTQLVKEGVWDYQESIPIYRHNEQVVGIVGAGRIGSVFARKVHALGCKVIAYDISAKSKKHDSTLSFIEFVDFEQLITQADIVSIHCPSDQAHHLFDESVFAKMKSTSYLINVSRGGIVDEAALYEALASKEIAGAALDVTEKEPISSTSPLLALEQFICTPHMAWYSEQAAQELKRKVAEEAVRYVKHEKLHYPVNKI
ncbi:C-terminal binding protein [Ureibacillus chungkukjangi]|uniref:D-3-phosphoglycerate dehydrogenase n=1 Tax=Ureibacillus chungkukjangi TaxID=1202712 RepID=A0A318TRE3_9BACL|nr:C-terminal binding protein [Ureibacillus chungkukjangi]MCM3390181.1 C-terminal binding protein [Ureibacillus chungkukjangi]PYF05608.1 D-3-phosphoglycerate dehydrogenase [Ureibacillus chungkukjangi]